MADRSGDRSDPRRDGRGRVREIPSEILEPAARRLRTLGHPVRLRLVAQLSVGERTVSELADALDVEPHLVSKHLAELLKVGVVRRAQAGNFARYSIADAATVRAIVLMCRGVADQRARLAEAVRQNSGDSTA